MVRNCAPENPSGRETLGEMDSLMRNCASKFDASHRPGMTSGMQAQSHIPATPYARVVHLSFAQRGRGECRVLERTRSLACKGRKAHELVTAGTRRDHPAFPHANGFNGFLRALPGDRACLSPSPRNATHCRELNASVEASGPHDFAVRFRNAFVFRTESVHRIPRPTFVTIAKRPSVQGRGTAGFMDLIWVKREGKYFCSNGWTGSISLIGFEKFVVWRKVLNASQLGDSLSAVIPGWCVSTRPGISRDASHLDGDVRS
jgi:hypothetical protein